MTATEIEAYQLHARMYPDGTGPLTSAEIAVDLDVSMDEADDVLDHLVRAGWFVDVGGGWLKRVLPVAKQPGERPQSEEE